MPSTKCHSSECRSNGHDLFDPEKSSTADNLHKKESINYGNGQCIDVELYTETVSVAGLSVENQLFGAAYSVSNIGDDKYVGYLGLGGFLDDGSINFNSTKNNHKVQARDYVNSAGYSQNAFQTGYGSNSQQFGMVTYNTGGFYQRKRWNKPDGEFIFGGVDHSVYDGKIAYFSLPTCEYGDSRYWKTTLSCVKFGHKVDIKLAPKSLASFSSSSNFITAPRRQAELLHKAMGAEYDANAETYVLPCDRVKELPDLTFTFDHYQVTIPASKFTSRAQDDDDEKCYSLIRGSDSSEKNWSLGGAFLNNFYTIYDSSHSRIGLATPKGGDKSVKIRKTGSRARKNNH